MAAAEQDGIDTNPASTTSADHDPIAQTQSHVLSEKEAPPGQESHEHRKQELEPSGVDNGSPSKDDQSKKDNKDQKDKKDKKDDGDDQPAGGFDDTPIPKRPNGYTLKFTLHRARNLPVADLNSMSSDPYAEAELTTDTPFRHKEDPPLRFRTPTIHRSLEPEWNEEWTVANVPSSGFKLKVRLYDEDPANSDDRLGNVHMRVDSISDSWPGIKDQKFIVKKRAGSKRAYLLRTISTCFGAVKPVHGEFYISVEVLGRTKDDGQNGRVYTLAPCRWTRHYSPMLGRLAGLREPDNDDDDGHHSQQQEQTEKRKVQRFNFQANEFQLQGPVPPELYHRFVEFKPFVKRMFTASGLAGAVMSKALQHQHARVYNLSRDTLWGYFPNGPSKEMTQKFLDLVHYDRGGRIFTYIITLDALMRFTETGKEFSIDMLSKHTMHSRVSVYIAFSGEFFIRRLKHSNRPPPPDPVDDTTYNHPPEHEPNPTHPADDIEGGPPREEPPTDPSHYELVIDNDSGTYRPNAALLPVLKDFLARSFPGLHVQTLDCQKDAKRMQRMKDEQRERKKREGDHIIVAQGSPRSSISSSDEEDFDRLQEQLGGDRPARREHGPLGQAAKDQKMKQHAKWARVKRDALRKGETEEKAREDADQAAPEARD